MSFDQDVARRNKIILLTMKGEEALADGSPLYAAKLFKQAAVLAFLDDNARAQHNLEHMVQVCLRMSDRRDD